MSEPNPAVPGRQALTRLGVVIERELHAGKQSRVFAGTVDGQQIVVKLTDARMAERTTLAERMLVAEALSAHTKTVIAPIRLGGELVNSVAGWLVTASPFIAGRRADICDVADARLLGRTLGELHLALGGLAERQLPPVAALEADDGRDRSRWQILHGDFSDQNVIVSTAGARVFDFDDCGYGPVLYDVANSLYMVQFDAEVNRTHDCYAAFRASFVDGYADATDTHVDLPMVDSLIDDRIETLNRWLDDLASAPIGIRSSSPDWQRVLRAFVAAHRADGTAGPRRV